MGCCQLRGSEDRVPRCFTWSGRGSEVGQLRHRNYCPQRALLTSPRGSSKPCLWLCKIVPREGLSRETFAPVSWVFIPANQCHHLHQSSSPKGVLGRASLHALTRQERVISPPCPCIRWTSRLCKMKLPASFPAQVGKETAGEV